MLEKKVAFITGGSKRLGRILCEQLSNMGYSLAVHYNKNIEPGLPEDTLYVQADFSNSEDVQTCFRDVLSKLGTIDLLINSAALFEASALIEGDIDHALKHIAVNLTAPILLTQLFAKHCKFGHVINITDAKQGYKNKTVYDTTKLALKSFTEKSAVELAPHIRINAIAPGWILNPEGSNVKNIEELEKSVPLQRQGGKSDIQGALMFLIDNSYITGQSLYIDGGRHCS